MCFLGQQGIAMRTRIKFDCQIKIDLWDNDLKIPGSYYVEFCDDLLYEHKLQFRYRWERDFPH